MKIETEILMRIGRYALLKRACDSYIPYIVACGYNDTDGTWAAGYYFVNFSNALKEFTSHASDFCADCEYVNAGCTYCKK